MGYRSINKRRKRWNISVRWIDDLCKAGRIYGAMKIVRFEKFQRLQKSLLM